MQTSSAVHGETGVNEMASSCTTYGAVMTMARTQVPTITITSNKVMRLKHRPIN